MSVSTGFNKRLPFTWLVSSFWFAIMVSSSIQSIRTVHGWTIGPTLTETNVRTIPIRSKDPLLGFLSTGANLRKLIHHTRMLSVRFAFLLTNTTFGTGPGSTKFLLIEGRPTTTLHTEIPLTISIKTLSSTVSGGVLLIHLMLKSSTTAHKFEIPVT